MPVKIRLTRRGRKKLALYDIVVADSRSPRDGKFIEKIGTYNPGTNPASVVLNSEKAFSWVMNGAQPSETVRTLLSTHGVMFKKHLQIGVNKGAITQDVADKRLQEWVANKEKSATSKIDALARTKESTKKDRLAAETKVNEARELKIKEKNTPIPVAAAPEAEAAPAAEGEAPAAAEEKTAE